MVSPKPVPDVVSSMRWPRAIQSFAISSGRPGPSSSISSVVKPLSLLTSSTMTVRSASQVLDLQRDALVAAGVPDRNLYSGAASGKFDDRPGLDACLKALRDGDTLVVWKLDRLGRNLHHAGLCAAAADGPDRPLSRAVAKPSMGPPRRDRVEGFYFPLLVLNSTPRAVAFFHLTMQSRDGLPSPNLSANVEGMPTALSTTSLAPPSDRSRIVHERD
jgi:hypothetical protein